MRYAPVLALAVSLAAQDTRFDVQSRLVLVPVTVTDAKGRSVDGLEAQDFVVLDNGRPQTAVVDSIATGVAPIALVVAVQSSGISAAVLAKAVKIGAMIQPLITGERGCAALVSFDERIQWRQDCTSDPAALVRAFQMLQPGEEKRARMLDAVQEAVRVLRARPNARRVLFLISESRDRDSETDLESAVIAAQTAGVRFYAAPYSAFKTAFTAKPSGSRAPRPPRGPERPGTDTGSPPSHANVPIPPPQDRVDLLGGFGELARLGKTKDTQVLTGSTGGMLFPFARQSGLEHAIEKLGTDLHTQYVLSFTPQSPAPGFHRLEVRLSRDSRWRIRARPGYWAAAGIR